MVPAPPLRVIARRPVGRRGNPAFGLVASGLLRFARNDVEKNAEPAHMVQPPNWPLVDGTASDRRGSISVAARNTRASALKELSTIWWLLTP